MRIARSFLLAPTIWRLRLRTITMSGTASKAVIKSGARAIISALRSNSRPYPDQQEQSVWLRTPATLAGRSSKGRS